MGTTGAEMLFVAKLLAWRLEKPLDRTVSIHFTNYSESLIAYLHGKSNSCTTCWSDRETGEHSLEEAIKEIERKEREIECQTEEVLEDRKLAISSDVEQNGITVGTSS
jgi:hypothetical protein